LVIAGLVHFSIDFLHFDRSLLLTFITVATPLVEAMLAVWLLRHFTQITDKTDQLKDWLRLLLVGVFSASLSCGAGAIALAGLSQEMTIQQLWQASFFAHALGILVVVPVVLSLSSIENPSLLKLSKSRMVELGLFLILLIAGTLLIFMEGLADSHSLYAWPYLITVLMVWGGLRFPRVISTMLTLLITLCAVWGIAQGFNFFSLNSDTWPQQATALQGFLALMAIAVLLLSVIQKQLVRYQQLIPKMQQQALLQESELRHRMTLEAVGSGSWSYEVESQEIIFSDRLLDLIGYRPGEFEISRESIKSSIHAEDYPKMRSAFLQHIEGKTNQFECELRVRHKNKRFIWMLLRGAAIYRDDQGRATQIVGANFEIDSRKRAEQALKESERQFRDLVEGSIQGIYIHNLKNTLFVNQATATIFGYDTIDEVQALDSIFQLSADYERARLLSLAEQRLSGAAFPKQYEFDGIRRDGQRININAAARKITWKGEDAIQVVVVDISAEKIANEVRSINELYYHGLFDLAPVALFEYNWTKIRNVIDQLLAQGITDIATYFKQYPELISRCGDSGDILNVNQAGIRMYACESKEEFIEKMMVAPLDDLHGAIDRFQSHISGAKSVTVESISERLNGEPFPVLITSEIIGDDLNDWSRIYTSIQDVSDLKMAETQLVESEARLQAFVDNSPEIIAIKDLDNRYAYINQAFQDFYNVTNEAARGKSTDFVQTPDYAVEVELEERLVIEKKIPRSLFETTFIDGEMQYWDTIRFPISTSQGDIIGSGIVSRDITDLKLKETELLQSEQRFRHLFEAAPVSLSEQDWSEIKQLIDRLRVEGVEDIHSYLQEHPAEIQATFNSHAFNVNSETLHLYGATDKSDYRQMMQNLDWRLYGKNLLDRIDGLLTGNRRIVLESEGIRKDGSRFPVRTTTQIIGDDFDDWSQIYTSLQDLSEPRKAELLLVESEERIRAFINNSPDMLILKDNEDRYIYTNRTFQDYYKVTNEETQGQLADTVHTPEFNTIVREEERLTKQSMQVRTMLDTEIVDGKQEYWLTSRFPLLNDQGELLGSGVISRDVTDIKVIEQELQQSEKRYRRLFETAPVALSEQNWSAIKKVVDQLSNQGIDNIGNYLLENSEAIDSARGTMIIDFNRETLRLFGTSDMSELSSILNTAAWRRINLEMIVDRILKFLTGQRRVVLEGTGIKADGKRFPIRVTSEIVGDDLKDWSQVYTSVIDISDEKESAQKLEDYQSELRSLAGKISLAEESERRRIASDLHDGTVQNLVLARMQLSGLKKDLHSQQSSELAGSINGLLESSLKETRSLIFELSPPILYELGLASAIEWLCEQFKQRTGATISLVSDDNEAFLAEELKVVLFQAVREFLVNISKHAKAQNVTITWACQAHDLNLTVEDEGIGFDITNAGNQQSSEGGFGLFSLRERLGLLGASFTMQSSESGTHVNIRAPTISDQSQSV